MPLGQVLTWAVIYRPAQARVITVAGRLAAPSRANEVVINETAARILTARVGSVIRLRGYRPDQVHQVLNGVSPPPSVWLPSVHVVGVIRTPVDLTENPDAPADVSFMGTGSLYVTAAFYHRFASSVGNMAGLAFHLKGGFRDLAAFEAEVRRVTGAQVLAGSDAHDAAVAAARGTSLQAFALLLFGVIVALSMVVIVGQSIARQAYITSDDFPVLRALGASRGQLFAVALAPGALVAVGGMALAVPIAYGLSAFTPVGLARRAEISPGLSFNAAILLSGAAALGLLLVGRAAITAFAR